MEYIRVGLLIDGKSTTPASDQFIEIDRGRIVGIYPGASFTPPSGAKVTDAFHWTMIPGMVDCHVHIHAVGGLDVNNSYSLEALTELQGALTLRAYVQGQKDLVMGFTTLRSLDSPDYVDVALRNAINSGLVQGPRLLVSGQGISVTGGHMDKGYWTLGVQVSGRTGVGDGPWGCRKAAREQLKRGVDVLKINACGGVLNPEVPWKQEMTYKEMAAVCDEARNHQIRVAAHTSGGPGITDALRAGVNSIEHGQWLTDEQIELMVRNGAFYIPTLLTNSRGVEWGQEATQSSDAEWAWLTKTENDKWDSLSRAHQAGVKVAVGTDAGFWVNHGENAGEMELLVKGGFSPMEAIQAATRVGADCLGLDREIGTVEPGKIADFVLVNGDPLADIRILKDPKAIAAVYQSGEKVAEWGRMCPR